MTETYRKIQLVGNRSFSVSLPKKWVLKNNLKKNDCVTIVERSNNLIISKKEKENNQNEVEVYVKDIKEIKAILILCYTRGLMRINLNFKNKEDALSAKPEILESISFLEGYRIMEEKENKITVIDSFGLTNISVKEAAKRMCMVLNDMTETIIKSKNKTKEVLEKETDRLYHLSKRILFVSSINSSFMEKNGIQDIEEIFLWRLIFKKFENLADNLEGVKKEEIIKEKVFGILEFLNEVFLMGKKINYSIIEEIKKKEYKNQKIEKIKELIIDILNNYFLIQLNKEIFGKSL